jgi:hypothetical protein
VSFANLAPSIGVDGSGNKVKLDVRKVFRRVRIFGADEGKSFYSSQDCERTVAEHGVFENRGDVLVSALDEGHGLVYHEREPTEPNVVLEVVTYFQVLDHRNLQLLQEEKNA